MRYLDSPMPRKVKKRRLGCAKKLVSFLFFVGVIIFLGIYIFQETGIKEQILRTQYPMKYQEFVEDSAKEFSLEKELVYALIRTESKFDPYAVSQTNARGLMQIQTETANDCAKELKLTQFSADDLFDPKTNIRLGCYYFSKLLKRYNGRRNLALAAYNGGPGNVEKWLKDDNYTNQEGDLIDIPFPETKRYIDRVNEAYDRYCSLYSSSK